MKITLVKREQMRHLLDRAFDGFNEIAVHEAGVLDGHVLALREKLSVARKARDMGELLRDQMDLLPASTARMRRNHRTRIALWRRVGHQLSGALRTAREVRPQA